MSWIIRRDTSNKYCGSIGDSCMPWRETEAEAFRFETHDAAVKQLKIVHEEWGDVDAKIVEAALQSGEGDKP